MAVSVQKAIWIDDPNFNRDHSWDSRFWGVVDEKEAKGKVINFYFSRDKKLEKSGGKE